MSLGEKFVGRFDVSHVCLPSRAYSTPIKSSVFSSQ